ncbi:oligosaccharide flippase family protein [Polaribacter sp. L3A8]|uniref:oligosaccharide flippase family protein n=1 Tax=Polaribacter sp. L3A8 TaxID=2686361 RepID=UPI0026745B80|nr:oligosaccharide flippase family protein [Polaribacter sp. L3A8]
MKNNNSQNSRRIAKNTWMLYIRMIFTILISLYTSRVVLEVLGISDFGIYNVAAGFVTMFGILSNSMSNATQRFLTFEIGKNDSIQLGRVFSMSVNIHYVIAFVIVLLAETVGLWFVYNKLTIPVERHQALMWVYQFSILTFVFNVISVPYNAIIIAHEKMKVFAVIGIIEVSLKLILVFMLQWLTFDKLKLYAFLMFLVSLIIRIIYTVYCRQNIKESKYAFFWDLNLFKKLLQFASWNLFGNSAVLMYGQGLNILLNIFFGPIINASYGIAYRLQAMVNNFVINFQTALNPQIIKSYASGDMTYMFDLIYKGAKYSLFLIFIFALPVVLETQTLLEIWLKTVPEYAAVFTQLMLINVVLSNLSGSLGVAAQATGNIKIYQIVIGILLILIIPVSFIFLKLGFNPQVVFYVSIVTSVISLFLRLLIVRGLIGIKIRDYLLEVVIRAGGVCILSIILPFCLHYYLEIGLLRLFVVSLATLFSISFFVYLLGLDATEKMFIRENIIKIKNKFHE